MSNRLDDIYEEAGRRIYEAQQARLSDQNSLAAKRPWRSGDVPHKFWDGYCADARAALTSKNRAVRLKSPRESISAGTEREAASLVKQTAADADWLIRDSSLTSDNSA